MNGLKLPPAVSTSSVIVPNGQSNFKGAVSARYDAARAPASQRPKQPVSPFLPTRMSVTRKGKERNLSDYNMDELEQMLARTLTLLNEPRLAQSLPGGVEGVQTRRSNIENRISELQDVKQIGKRLDGTHLEGDPPDPGGMSDDVIMAAASSVNDMPSQDRHGQSGPADHTQAPNAISLEQSIAYQQIIARRDAIKAANQARRVPPGDGTGVRPAPKPSASKYESDDDAGWSEDDSDFGYLDDEPLSMSDLIEAL